MGLWQFWTAALIHVLFSLRCSHLSEFGVECSFLFSTVRDDGTSHVFSLDRFDSVQLSDLLPPLTVQVLTESEMRTQESFTVRQMSLDGFDFENVWQMGDFDYPYPIFRAQFEH